MGKKIDLNMQLGGKEQKIKEDINFFEVYRNSSKAGNRDLKSLLIITICFALVVGIAFGGLKVTAIIFDRRTEAIRADMARPEIQGVLDEINNEVSKKTMLESYLGLINGANKKFAKFNTFDAGFFKAIADSVPLTTNITGMNITVNTVDLVCTSRVFTDASLFMQRLAAAEREKKSVAGSESSENQNSSKSEPEYVKIFANVTFNDVVLDAKQGCYTFSVNCIF